MGQNQVSEGVNILCWLAAALQMFYGNLPEFDHNVKVGNNVHFGNIIIRRKYPSFWSFWKSNLLCLTEVELSRTT